MKKTGLVILIGIISLLLIANPTFARPENGKSGQVGKFAYGVESTAREVGKTIKENESKFPPLKAQLQKGKSIVKGDFSDTKAHWAKGSIDKVESLGWISGYPDMTFKPDAPVTGIEVVSMIVSLAGDLDNIIESESQETSAVDEGAQDVVSGEETAGDQDEVSEGENGQDEESGIPDVPGWAKDAMKKAAALKIVNVNRFHSQVQATRAQAAVMLAKALGLQPVDISSITFSDQVLISSEDLGYILALAEAGIIKGTPDGRFNPNGAVTRAEIAAMLAAVADEIGDEDTGDISDQVTQTPEDSAEQNSVQANDQTNTGEDNTTGQDEQTGAEAA